MSARADLLEAPEPPREAPLAALWYAHRGNWDAAHVLVQDAAGPDAAWVHAHLHRAEGDLGNAGYWYRRAGRPAADGDLAAERAAIASALTTPTGKAEPPFL